MQAEETHEGEQEQEILQPMAQALDSSTIALLSKSEIDTQIATAKKYPRKITALLNTATALITADAEAADEAIYALPRGGKIIEGPSVRFAEVMAYSWGNCRCGARVISEDEEFVTSMGTFIDLEANVAIGYEVKRRITTKEGKRFNTDVIQQTANAACSIALRNAILRGIPKAVWRKVYNAARQAVAGDIKTLDTRRNQMLKSFELMGVKREQVFAKLEIKGIDDITLDHLVSLRGVYNAIRENEITAARAFAPADTEDKNLAEKSKHNLEEIKKKYAPGEGPIEVGPLRAAPKPVSETDPAYAEKLRKEAERQTAAVAEKFGAGQTSEGAGTTSDARSDDKGAVAPAPSESQQPSGSEPAAKGPETPTGVGSGPAEEEAGHGLPLNFE